MPNDHVFGMRTTLDHDMDKIIQNQYDQKCEDRLEQVEQDFKPARMKFRLKPPKTTIAHIFRTKTTLGQIYDRE